MSRKNQHIQVFVRCRPPTASEKRLSSTTPVEVRTGTKQVQVMFPERHRSFTFDGVFPGNAKQVDVYRAVMGSTVGEVLMGYNCTVLAYGQTGTGKTFTMEGERSHANLSWEQDPTAGIIPRALHELFERLQGAEVEFTIRVSFVELYNEEIFDLLSATEDTTRLRIFEDSTKKGSVIIQGLEEITVHSKDEVYFILEKGAAKRQMAATLLNASSSRSHTVFSITVHLHENTDDGEELLKTGKLNLVDLAGSENVGRSGAVERRAREAGNINQSLLTLGRVITALVDKTPHVPYRESKLTRLLQDSLGGRTKTSIIATISPSVANLEETLSTLDYAHRARNITNSPEINQKTSKRALIRWGGGEQRLSWRDCSWRDRCVTRRRSEYTEEMERLRRDLVASREKNGIFVDKENYRAMETRITAQSREILDKMDEIVVWKEKLDRLNESFKGTKKEKEEKVEVLEHARKDLHLAKQRLKETKTVLQRTATERDEQRHLLEVHSATEASLSRTASALVAVAQTTTVDIDLLQNKLRRTSEIESENRTNLAAFGGGLRDLLTDISSQLGQHTSEQRGIVGDVVASIGRFQDLVRTFDEGLRIFSTKAQEQNDLAETELRGAVAATVGSVRVYRHKVVATLRDNLRQNQETADGVKTSVRNAVQGVRSDLRGLHELCDALYVQSSSIRECLARSLSQFENGQAALLEDLSLQVGATSAALQEKLKENERLVAEMERSSTKAYKERNTSIARLMSELCAMLQRDKFEAASRERAAGKVARNSSSIVNLIPRYAAMTAGTRESAAAMTAAQASECSIAGAAMEHVAAAHFSNVRRTERKVSSALESMEQDVHSRLGGFVESLSIQSKSIVCTSVAALQLREGHFSQLASLAKHHRRTADESQEKVEASATDLAIRAEIVCAETLERVGRVSDVADAIAETTALSVAECRETVTDFEAELREYIPTGCTPQCKEYPFPTWLPHTSPDEAILERRRRGEPGRGTGTPPFPSLASDKKEAECKENLTATKPATKRATNATGCTQRRVLAPNN